MSGCCLNLSQKSKEMKNIDWKMLGMVFFGSLAAAIVYDRWVAGMIAKKV